jgi:2-oxo-hept-3-ene-1,7-dioate hydratase
MTGAEIAAAAQALFAAERDHVQIPLISLANQGMTMDDAYAVQAAYVAQKQAAGIARIGWKIGLTSKAMQAALGIDIPDSGVLLADMAFANGATIPAGRFIAPRIEAEIAFVMGGDLAGEDVTEADVLAATDHVVPSLEILDTRILRSDPATGTARNIFDTISDNAANAGIVTGGKPVRPGDVDLRRVGAIVSRNGEVEETGLGAGVLGDPVRGIVWLARRLAAHGIGIKAGEILLSGSFIRPIECPPGSHIHADFGDFGTVETRFA